MRGRLAGGGAAPLVLAILLVAATAGGCARKNGTIEGRVTAGGAAAGDAEVRLFVKAGEERSGSPFSVGKAGADGRYRMEAPAGSYHVVARKTVAEGGRERTFKGEHPRNPVTVAPGGTAAGVDIALVEMSGGGFVPRDDTAVAGAVVSAGKPAPGVFVYAYPAEIGTVRGPAYVAYARTDGRGRFRLALRDGTFALVARRKGGENETGAMREAGESSGDEPRLVTLAAGEEKDAGSIVLHAAREEKRSRRASAGGLERGGAEVRGTVVRDDGSPAAGIFVMAFVDHRMIGRPFSISGKTGKDGAFLLRLPRAGRIFLGARSEFGGPVSPGEWVGTYDGSADHSLDVGPGEAKGGIRIRVAEKW